MNITSDRLSRWMPAMFAYASVKLGLGLVYGIAIEDGVVDVTMTMTTPGCPASEVLPEMARAAVAGAVGTGTAVVVRVVWDPPWSPAMIDDDAARSLGFRTR